MANPRFPYQALDSSRREIRLLRLEPAVILTDGISCVIEHAFLSNSPKYETISYVWGEPIFPEVIILNGQSFNITTNLFDALKHLRLVDEPRTLWIDAICIDQSNNLERGQQVSFMGEIYTAADINTAWLGERTNQSDLTLDLIGDLNKRYLAHNIATPRHSHEMSEIEGLSLSQDLFEVLATIPAETWAAIDDTFAKRHLWSRVWIVQEIGLAKRVFLRCGEKEIEWEHLQRFWRVLVFWYKKILKLPTSGPATMTMLPTSFLHDQRVAIASKGFKDDTSLIELWYIFHRWNATDPRDKLFALLGLCEQPSIISDYSSSASKVFMEISRKNICETQSLNILCMGYRPRRNASSSLPSWAEDFGDMYRTPSYTWNNKTSGEYCAGGSLSDECAKRINFDINLSKLMLRGYSLGEVTFLGPTIPRERFTSSEAFQIVQESRPLQLLGRDYAASGEDGEVAYWRTLIRNATGKGRRLNSATLPEFQAEYRELVDSEESSRKSVGFGSANKFVDALRINWGFRFAVTADGLMALVPGETKLGDVACILQGSIAGHILVAERSGNHGCQYKLVGAAYIHGLMYGELQSRRKHQGLALQDFVLV